jgi:hypothetical protein
MALLLALTNVSNREKSLFKMGERKKDMSDGKKVQKDKTACESAIG